MGRYSVGLDHLNPVTCREHLRLPLSNLVEKQELEFPDITGHGTIVCRGRLGGLFRFYHRQAA
jgi:hypothetical protein